MNHLPHIGIPLTIEPQQIDIFEGEIAFVVNLLTSFALTLPNKPPIEFLHIPAERLLLVIVQEQTLKIHIIKNTN